MIKEKNN